MILSEAIEAATAIVKRYPNGGRGAGDGYIGALASTLMGYPRQVALRCADFPIRLGQPLRGVCATAEFLPTPATLIGWCEKQTDPLRDQVEWDRRAAEQIAERNAILPRDGRLTYAELKAKYGDANGGWGIDGGRSKKTHQWLSAADLAGICGEDTWAKIPNRVAE